MDTQTKEEWRPVVGFCGKYEVSNKGRVKSLNYKGHGKQRVMKPGKDGSGYLFIYLRKDGKYYARKIHRTVFEAFVSPIPEYNRGERGIDIVTIDHLDGNKENNCVENLEVVSQTENVHRFLRKINGTEIKYIYQYTKNGRLVKRWNSTRECESEGYCDSCISMCCNNKYYGKKNEYRGYIWSYIELNPDFFKANNQCIK